MVYWESGSQRVGFQQRIANMNALIEADAYRSWRAPHVSIFDVAIDLTAIVYERYVGPLNFVGRRRPTLVEDCALEGRVATLDSAEGLFVYLSAYDDLDADRDIVDADARSPCYISTDRADGHFGSARLYIRNVLFRRLVELHSTKRIDAVSLSIKFSVNHRELDELFRPFEHLDFRRGDAPLLSPCAMPIVVGPDVAERQGRAACAWGGAD